MIRKVEYSEQAREDIIELNDYIAYTCDAPLTAKRYIQRLEVRLLWLQGNAEIFPVIPELTFSMGYQIRRLNFEKMAILYSFDEDKVYVHRIIPQSMVIY